MARKRITMAEVRERLDRQRAEERAAKEADRMLERKVRRLLRKGKRRAWAGG